MRRCALLTSEKLMNQVVDEEHLARALEQAGWEVQWVIWKDTSMDWDQFDCAIVRTTWDCYENPDFFLNQLQAIEDSTCLLLNPLSLIQWNSKKTYLQELLDEGVNSIPTHWTTYSSKQELLEWAQSWQTHQVVVKPQVGAGSLNTFALDLNKEDWEKPLVSLVGVDIMVQPFMKNVVQEGEFSALYFSGQFSHLVLKTPKADDFRSQEEFGSQIRQVEPTVEQSQFCQNVLSKIPSPWLYARVDFISDDSGDPCLIELELVEPSLYFKYEPKSAARMVMALDWLVENEKETEA